MNNEYFLYEVTSGVMCSIEIKQTTDGYRWIWNNFSSGSVRFSGGDFKSQSECRKDAIEFLESLSLFSKNRSITDDFKRSDSPDPEI